MNFSNAILLVQHLRKEGVSFWPDDNGNIKVYPAGLLTPEHHELIRAHKPAVFEYGCITSPAYLPFAVG